MKNPILLAAISGMMLGATVPAMAGDGEAGKAKPGAEKHGCKGQNACKGQGGCKTDKHGCKGQNACKGQGGCKS